MTKPTIETAHSTKTACATTFVFSSPSSRSSLAFDETVHCLVFIVNTNPLVPSGFGYRKTETAAPIDYHGRGFAINEAQQLPWEGFSLRENAALF
jgi:hypothetical protein